MSPRLKEQQPVDPGVYKFVRGGEDVAWGAYPENHKDIARKFDIGVAIGGALDFVRRLVDDAGWIRLNRDGTYFLSGNSSSCRLTGDAQSAREESVKVVASITGKDTNSREI